MASETKAVLAFHRPEIDLSKNLPLAELICYFISLPLLINVVQSSVTLSPARGLSG